MEEMDDSIAAKRFPGKLKMAALGVVEEGDKIRVIYDGSNTVEVNHRIKPQDLRCPGAGEVKEVVLGCAVAEPRASCQPSC